MVDDTVADHFMVVTALIEVFEKPKILSVFDGRHALEYIEDSRETNLTPDIIVLDLKRSTLTNAQYFSALKKDEWLKSIPIIVLIEPGTVSTEDLKAIGADDIYIKNSDDLIDIFRTVAEKWLSEFYTHSDQ